MRFSNLLQIYYVQPIDMEKVNQRQSGFLQGRKMFNLNIEGLKKQFFQHYPTKGKFIDEQLEMKRIYLPIKTQRLQSI